MGEVLVVEMGRPEKVLVVARNEASTPYAPMPSSRIDSPAPHEMTHESPRLGRIRLGAPGNIGCTHKRPPHSTAYTAR